MSATPSRVCFIAESQVGIGSVAKTLKPLALRSESPHVDWVEVTYAEQGGWLERMPLPRRLSGTARGFLQTREGLRRGPYDALLFLTHNPAVFHVGALRRMPTLLWCDVTPVQLDEQAELYGHPQTRNAAVERIKKAVVRRAFLAARRCVGWSEWVRRSFVRDYGVPEERTAVQPPGLDLSLWKAPERPPRQAGTPLRMLFVGGDFRRKGGPLLLDVFRESLRGRYELDIVTREPVEPEPGVRVHRGLTAGSDALLGLYRAVDLFVLPTLADCQPVASMEAMAMGLPVVTTRIAANAEVVDEGRSGWLVPPANGRALKECLLALAEDIGGLGAAGQAGVEIVHARYDATRTLDALFSLALRAEGPGEGLARDAR
jgi:glycosyltransferase involved in cell wall biosynthesis